ncbi:MAG: hypothetical protein ACOYT7_01725 [Patescibacteria group bacterium]
MAQSRERTHRLIESFEAKALKKRSWGVRLAAKPNLLVKVEKRILPQK